MLNGPFLLGLLPCVVRGAMKIEILVSEESSYLSHYHSEYLLAQNMPMFHLDIVNKSG